MFDFLTSGEDEREERVDFDEFEEWFVGELQELRGFEWRDVESRYGEIEGIVDEVEENLDALKREEVPEEVAPRLKKAGTSNKKVLTGRIQSFVDRFQTPEETDYRTVCQFLEDKSEEIEKVSSKVGKSVKFVKKLHRDKTENLMESLQDLEKMLQPGDKLLKVKETLSKYESLIKKHERTKDLKQNIKDIHGKLDERLKEKEELKENLRSLKESEKTEEIEEKERKVEELKSEIQKTKNAILGDISPVKRGLKKLRYFGYFSEKEGLLTKYIDSPLDAVRNDEGLSFLKSAARKLKESLKSRELDFSDDEAKRLRNELERIDLKDLENLVKRWEDLEQGIQEARESIEDLDMQGRREEIKSEIQRKEEKIEELQDRIEKEEDKLKKAKKSVEELEDEIKERVHELLKVELKLE
ncbi:MAG: hypothetical protein ACLFTQ_00850 [Candidatus Aenigmatarchaeota archaeon]